MELVILTESEVTSDVSDCTDEIFVCPQCQNTWECEIDMNGPLQCKKCETVIECDIAGIGALREDQLGKKLGKYSWCATCGVLTLNVPGTTYCSQPLAIAGYAGQGNKFFACEKCGKEKFWRWSYHCPRCDADNHAVICIDEKTNQDYEGNLNWNETWKCLICGLVYDINNGT